MIKIRYERSAHAKYFWSMVIGITLFFLLLGQWVQACTSIIVSGKVTPDGRPYIFKNRDTPDVDNLEIIMQGSKYTFLATVAAKDSLAHNIWAGHNEKGFAIFDTDAYNLNEKEGNEQFDVDSLWYNTHGEGWVMKRALETCASLKEFENMLDTLPRPLYCNGNIACLDAEGNVAYYEVGNNGYVKYDVNDPKVAPFGYLIRTNFAFSGNRKLDQGLERYMTLNNWMLTKANMGSYGFEQVIRQLTRYLVHGLTKVNLHDEEPADSSQVKFVAFRDFIPRYLTASATLIQGVKKGENPLHTVSWTIAGSPLTTIAIPLVILPNGHLPQIVTRSDKGHSTLVHAGLSLKKKLFPIQRGNGKDYMDLSKLINTNGTGILQQIKPIEDEVMSRGKAVVEQWRKGNNDKSNKEISKYYEWVDDFVTAQYKQRFNININNIN